MNAETRSEMFGRLLKQIPNPTTELNYSTSFELLVAVTLSAQATDKSVNQVTDILFPLANTPESISKSFIFLFSKLTNCFFIINFSLQSHLQRQLNFFFLEQIH